MIRWPYTMVHVLVIASNSTSLTTPLPNSHTFKPFTPRKTEPCNASTGAGCTCKEVKAPFLSTGCNFKQSVVAEFNVRSKEGLLSSALTMTPQHVRKTVKLARMTRRAEQRTLAKLSVPRIAKVKLK